MVGTVNKDLRGFQQLLDSTIKTSILVEELWQVAPPVIMEPQRTSFEVILETSVQQPFLTFGISNY